MGREERVTEAEQARQIADRVAARQEAEAASDAGVSAFDVLEAMGEADSGLELLYSAHLIGVDEGIAQVAKPPAEAPPHLSLAGHPRSNGASGRPEVSEEPVTVVKIVLRGHLAERIANGELFAGLFVWNREQFREQQRRMVRERVAERAAEGGRE